MPASADMVAFLRIPIELVSVLSPKTHTDRSADAARDSLVFVGKMPKRMLHVPKLLGRRLLLEVLRRLV